MNHVSKRLVIFSSEQLNSISFPNFRGPTEEPTLNPTPNPTPTPTPVPVEPPTTPAPTLCEDRSFFFNGNTCTNEFFIADANFYGTLIYYVQLLAFI